MNLTELRTTAIQKLETETLTTQSRAREEAILETVIELEKRNRELDYLRAEIAVKDMAIADRNKEVADLYLWIEEAETFMYEQSRRKVREVAVSKMERTTGGKE